MAHAFLKAAATIMVAAGDNRPIDRLCEIYPVFGRAYLLAASTGQ